MGLLTDPKQRQRVVRIISKYNQKLCILLYLAGIVWFFALAYEPLNASTYFSENALLPGLVENEFYAERDVENLNKQLVEELKKDEKATPKRWIYKQFQSLGLDVYMQNFTLQYPYGFPAEKQKIGGQNLYAVLRARRSSSIESVVISSPLRARYAEERHTSGGIAIMLAMAKHLRTKPYIAKDVIFVLPDYDEIGMQAWLDGYHQTTSEFITPGPLPGRAGQIQAALNLEIPPENVGYLNMKIEGTNGQLPNLDFVNLVVRLCRKERIKITLNKMEEYIHNPESMEGYLHSLKTMLNMMWHQAPGAPTGNHGLFHRFHIEALTLSGELGGRKSSVRLDKTGRIVEGVFRSLNNLLERFHQSFFFYILPGTQRYISIGIYMPPFGLMVAAGLIKALALWIGAESSSEKGEKEEQKKDEGQGDTGESVRDQEDERAVDEEHSSEQDTLEETEEEREKLDSDEEEQEDLEFQPTGLQSLVPIISICILLGALGYYGPNFLSRFSTPFQLRVQDSLMFGLLALFCASLLYPRMIRRKLMETDKFVIDWQTLKSVALILLCLVMFSVALTNISLAFFLTASMIPVCTFVTPTKSRVLTWLQKLLLLLVSPASFLLIGAAIHTEINGPGYDNIMEFLGMAWTYVKQCILMRLLDQSFFGSWTYMVMSLAVFPTWLMFWGVPHCEPS